MTNPYMKLPSLIKFKSCKIPYILDPDFSVYTWYPEQDEEKNETVIYANFQGADPNKENVEINVRRNCFYPDKKV